MNKDEALKLALDALEYLSTQIKPDYEHSKAITAIKAALEAKDEPVATLLLQSKQNFERNFGSNRYADWIYADLVELVNTTPPQRTWVGLTDEDIEAAYWQTNPSLERFARAIEAKLKEKNT